MIDWLTILSMIIKNKYIIAFLALLAIYYYLSRKYPIKMDKGIKLFEIKRTGIDFVPLRVRTLIFITMALLTFLTSLSLFF